MLQSRRQASPGWLESGQLPRAPPQVLMPTQRGSHLPQGEGPQTQGTHQGGLCHMVAGAGRRTLTAWQKGTVGTGRASEGQPGGGVGHRLCPRLEHAGS